MKKKREYASIYLFELDTLAKHFEEMAQQGWMLTAIHVNRLTYEQCPSQHMHFFVDIYHKGGYLNPGIISDDERFYADLIGEYGYTLVGRTSNFQVFTAPKEDMIPIHSYQDEEKKAQRKTILKYEVSNHLLPILFFVFYFLIFSKLSLNSLVNNLTLAIYCIFPFLFILLTYRIYPTLKWLVMKDNYHISTQQMIRRNTRMTISAILLLLCFLASIFFSSTTYIIPVFITIILSALAFLLLDPLLARFIKKYHSVIALVLCIWIGMGINIRFFIHNLSPTQANYAHGELTYQDLRENIPTPVDYNSTNDESFLLRRNSYYEYYQDNQDQTRNFSNDINFYYELYTIKFPFMKEFFQDKAIEDAYESIAKGESTTTKKSWELYQGRHDQCLIWDSYILYISIHDQDKDVPLTNEQINTIIDQFTDVQEVR